MAGYERKEIWTIKKILDWTKQFFADKGIESPRLDAEVLLGHLLKKDRMYLYVHFDEPLQAEELAAFREMVKQRIRRVPVAYILGEREFMGLSFKVTPATLIPRPDTEILVEAVLERLKSLVEKGETVHFADIGTGSGAICLSLLHELEEATAETVDISPEARAVAEENAENLGVAERISFHTGDLLAPLTRGAEGYQAIVSNPPYIPQKDIETLEPEVRAHEPMGALAGGADGLDFYRRLCTEAPALLAKDGFMAFEVGIHQAQDVARLAEENPRISRTEILKDYAGIERVVLAYR